MNYVLSPSILAADFKVLGQEMKKTEDNGAEYIHFDVMDGMFVPSISFGMPVMASIHDATEQFMDAHLMVQEPIRYVEAFQKAGADSVTVHVEACEDVKATLNKIRECGMKVGLSINPETDVKEVVPYLEEVDMILVMCVHPGFGGQKFIPESLDKIRAIRAMLNEKNLETDIQADGGVYVENVREVLDAGANVIVAGSAVFRGDAGENTAKVMSKRIIIISGGELNEEFVLSILEKEENQYVIGVDRGMEFLCRHQILPNYIVGDFDSVKKEIGDYYRNETNVPIREFNPVKDASDTEIAIRLAMTLGAKEILILGATGGRIDHLWANVQSLAIPFKAGIDAVIMDTQNKIRLIGGGETHLKKGETYGPYFSVFPLGEEVYGFSIKGAKYPLDNHTLIPYDSLCVSNQFQEDEVTISFMKGIVILMETKDR